MIYANLTRAQKLYKRIYRNLFIFVLSITILSILDCTMGTNTSPQPTISNTTPTLMANTSWQYRWLMGNPCTLPCWEGITPGLTIDQQAVDILKRNPLIETNSVIIEKRNDVNMGTVSWHWAGDNRFLGGEAFFSLNDNTHSIYMIRPYYPQIGLTLGGAINSLGQPTFTPVPRQLMIRLALIFSLSSVKSLSS